ncbi:MAG: hypothetical protein PWQ24_1395 [Mesotoga sp.]|nr:hypothetical protein [Mesotoga sp.]
MKVLHVAAGAYPSESNPVACIFVQKLVEMQRSAGLESSVLSSTVEWTGFFRKKILQDKGVFRFIQQRGIGRLPTRLQNSYFSRIAVLYKENCEIKPDIIHCHFSSNAKLGKALSQELGCPYIVTLHENHWWFEELIFGDKRKFMKAVADSDMITRPNSIDIIDLFKWDIPSERIAYLPNYVDENSFNLPSSEERLRARQQLGVESKRVVLNIASLHKKKGQELLIEAIAILKERIPEIILWIIGEGPEENRLRVLSEKLGIEKNVLFLGRIENNKIQFYLACADVFAMPSKAESFGISQVEGMLAGLPVVATNNFGSEEIVIDGRNGFICRTRDSRDYARLLYEAIIKEWDRKDIRQSAVDRFGSKLINERLKGLYNLVKVRFADNHEQND